MITASSAAEFTIEVDGLGAFTFARRTMRHEFKIQAEYSRLVEGIEVPTPQLDLFAGIFSQLKVLTVAAPDGWDIEKMDPLDDDEFQKLVRVHAALRAKEGSFRRSPKADGEGAGKANVGESGVLVSPSLPAAAD